MTIDATFWVGVSFILFFLFFIYLKVLQKLNEFLNKLITDIKNQIDESEKLRLEAKTLLNSSQSKLESAQEESKKIIDQAKRESESLIIEMNDKFHKSSEIKKKLAENKISQMKEATLKEIKDNSIKLAMKSVKKIISTSIDKSKLDNLFKRNLEESKIAIKKIKT
jgi:F-type H+-transporting ATPase subunit b